MRLKGSTGGSKGTKTRRPIEYKIRVLQLVEVDKVPAKEAVSRACTEFNLPKTQGMIDYPASFVDGYRKSVNKALEKGDETIESLVVEAGLPLEPETEEAIDESNELAVVADDGEEFMGEDD